MSGFARFENEETREELYSAVYDSDVWKNDISPRLSSMLDRDAMVVTRLSPTELSVLH